MYWSESLDVAKAMAQERGTRTTAGALSQCSIQVQSRDRELRDR